MRSALAPIREHAPAAIPAWTAMGASDPSVELPHAAAPSIRELELALRAAQARLHAAQRASVLGRGDPDATDQAIVAERQVRVALAARADRRTDPAGAADDLAAVRLVHWLVEASRECNGA